ncbi:MAG: hypothetical protein QNL91_05615 [Candidatus Krumholzibacteria bacterium]|nr:hypothetical protein [Candidatus Krumholzibacteria bacterium]
MIVTDGVFSVGADDTAVFHSAVHTLDTPDHAGGWSVDASVTRCWSIASKSRRSTTTRAREGGLCG